MASKRKIALQACAEKSFLVLPCAFHAHSTTQWFYDVYPRNQEVGWFEKDGFSLRYLGVHQFFDAPTGEEFEEMLSEVRLLSAVLDRLLEDHATLFPMVDPDYPVGLPNYFALEEAGEAGAEIFTFLKKCASVLNVIDPLDWASYKVAPGYLRDYMQYGFCVCVVERLDQA